MKKVQILEDQDKIAPTDWCRPLAIISMSGGHSDYYSFRSAYGGTPENNAEWCLVSDIFGECWDGVEVGELVKHLETRYEFVRGDVPVSHRLDMVEGRYRGARDINDPDYRTFDEWSDSGYAIKKGEKSSKRNRWNEPLFHRDQTRYWK